MIQEVDNDMQCDGTDPDNYPHFGQTLSDLLIRRVHLAFETPDHGVSVAARAADIVAPLLGWDDQTKSARVREYTEDIERMFAIG